MLWVLKPNIILKQAKSSKVQYTRCLMGKIHTGKTHTKTSKPVVHFKDLSARAKKVAKS